MNIFLVKPGAEDFAITECNKKGISIDHSSSGILQSETTVTTDFTEFCFPSWYCLNVKDINLFESRENPLDTVCNWFCKEIQNERFEAKWPLFWLTCSDNGFTSDTGRADLLKEKLKKRISRIVKLADNMYPQISKTATGLFVVELKAEKKLFVSRQAVFQGQRRMKDDQDAPSRSYLKIEEAFAIFNRSPNAGEIVCDLGAAPGGWTWAALRRNAMVFAIDNGPLKKGPLNHPNVHHIRHDAYTWKPANTPVDWLFCDMVDQPFKVFDLIKTWFVNEWCKHAVVNFKYGYNDPGNVLDLIYNPKGLTTYSQNIQCRHLFHDRDEITVLADVKS